MHSEDIRVGKIVATVIFLLTVLIGGGLYGCPQYNLYSQEMAGKAVLAEAESSRQVKTLEAKAALESSVSLAKAEVIRAKGAAQANTILQNSLGGPDGYLRYLQIQAIDAKDASVIYVPTEGGLPVTESIRLLPRAPVPE